MNPMSSVSRSTVECRALIAAISFLSLVKPLAAQGSTLHETWSTYLQQRVGSSSAGYAWVVIRRGEVVSQGGRGSLSIDSTGRLGATMSPTTRMQIASASKPITAMALVLALHERGISLDTPIVALLGDLARAPGQGVERVTVRHLLQHKSGYPFGYLWPPRLDSTRALLTRSLPNPPGDRARY